MNKIEKKISDKINGLIGLSSSIGGKEWNINLYETYSEEYLPSDVLDYYEDDVEEIPIQKKELEKQKLELMNMIKELYKENKELNERINQIDKENERIYQMGVLEERIQTLVNLLGDGDESDDKRLEEEIRESEEELKKL